MRRPGDHALLRQLFRGRVWNAVPVVVIEDTPQRHVVWMPPGVVGMAADGDLFDGWELRPHRWERRPHGIVRATEAGRPYSLLHFRHDDGSFRGWYVNLEDPQRPTALGWDFEDHLLDLWFDADGTWRWLDEDELERAVELGLYDDAKARAVRRAGEEVLARVLAGEGPMPSGFEAWTPPPAWSLPSLPEGWDDLSR